MIAAGQSIGNYRILKKIGTGGMGAVYLAEHPLIGKRVALKVIHRELAGNREVVSRFFQEARAVNQIGNEHIVEIHDFGVTPEGDHFYIMEYLEGATLAAVLSRDKPLEVMRSLHIGAQIASALAAAHAAGIIHRDLKPDNVMVMSRLGDQDFVKVLDFGLAKVFSAETAVKTAAGVLLGTPQYMSPEACESKRDIDHRTDIYALGVLLFQMMTGALPFDGESMGEVLVKQVAMLPPAPRGMNPAIPPSVEQILLRCLAKRVDARFPTMPKLREALLDPEGYLRGAPPIAPARSVGAGAALGEARALAMPAGAPAAAMQKTRLAPAHPLSLPQEPQMNTMRIATPVGYSSRPPRKVWPVVLGMGLLLGVGGGVLSVTCFGHDGGGRSRVADGRTPSAGDAGRAVGAAAARGSEGAGSSAGAQGGAASPPTGVGGSAGSGGSGEATASGATGGTDRASPGPTFPPARTVHLTIESVPPGAQVKGPGERALGKTPVAVDWPTSDAPVTFELRHAGYRTKQKQAVINGNTRLVIELERMPVVRHGSGPGLARPTGPGDGLMRPDE